MAAVGRQAARERAETRAQDRRRSGGTGGARAARAALEGRRGSPVAVAAGLPGQGGGAGTSAVGAAAPAVRRARAAADRPSAGHGRRRGLQRAEAARPAATADGGAVAAVPRRRRQRAAAADPVGAVVAAEPAARCAPIKIWIAGDSTVASSGGTPCPIGWGGPFPTLFGTGVTVTNSAVGGRSVRTWLYSVQTVMDATGECVLDTDAAAIRSCSRAGRRC
jgi:hypothetical protein